MTPVTGLNAAWITWPCEQQAVSRFPPCKTNPLTNRSKMTRNETREHTATTAATAPGVMSARPLIKILLVWLNVSGTVAIQLSAGRLVSCDICWRRRQQIPWGLNKTRIIISNECGTHEIFNGIMEDAVECFIFLSPLVFAHFWCVS